MGDVTNKKYNMNTDFFYCWNKTEDKGNLKYAWNSINKQ
jgi:hypothetical protein